jgi:hypothetical protein
MLAVVSVFAVVVVSMLITRIATMALVITGMSQEGARFQARSALTGTGYTTNEAESMVMHPVRRRIVMVLMLVGSAGIASVAATLILSFAGADRTQAVDRLLVLVAGLLVLLLVMRSRFVERPLDALIRRGLRRWTDLDVRDMHGLLHLASGYVVTELHVDEGDWLAGRCLRAAPLRSEGIAVLGIERRGGGFVSVPTGDTEIRAGDVVIAYGHVEHLSELDRRRAGPDGDRAHERAAERHRAHLAGAV